MRFYDDIAHWKEPLVNTKPRRYPALHFKPETFAGLQSSIDSVAYTNGSCYRAPETIAPDSHRGTLFFGNVTLLLRFVKFFPKCDMLDVSTLTTKYLKEKGKY